MEFGITAAEYRAVLEGRPNEFLTRVQRLYDQMRQELLQFFPDTQFYLSPLSLAYVVQKLQFVSLEGTAADVKGEAFQVFFTRYQRGDRGEFFTPQPIVELAVEMIAPKPNETVVDPACGSGSFLLQTVRYIRNHYPDACIPSYIRNRLFGMEFNPDVAGMAQLRLTFEGAQWGQIRCVNALEAGLDNEEQYDVVLANPPFGSRGKVNDPQLLQRYDLGYRWQRTPQGWRLVPALTAGQSPEILFIELCLRLVRPGGRLAVVLPDGILQNATTEHVRAWIRDRAELAAVVSLPQHTFVPYGTGIKTSLIVLKKRPTTASHVFMAIPRRIGYDVKGQPCYVRDGRGQIVRDARGNPVIDTELPQLARLFHTTNLDSVSSAEGAFWLSVDSLDHRLDAEHYLPRDTVILERLSRYPSRRLREIAEIVTATEPFRSTPDQEIRYIAISDVIPELSVVASWQTLRACEAPSRAKYRLQKGDLITAVAGASTGTSQHASAIVSEREDGAICTNGFAVLRNLRGVDPYYLLAFFRSESFLRQVRRLLRGHAIPAISLESLGEVVVPIPPEHLQQEIAFRVRSAIDAYKQGLENFREAASLLEQTLCDSEQAGSTSPSARR
ncbi:MAG: N-6 DNA methylase [Fimbriimonadales bacterium]|nr:N-6 DNA methylase [Fimbriimonadales bacterium]